MDALKVVFFFFIFYRIYKWIRGDKSVDYGNSYKKNYYSKKLFFQNKNRTHDSKEKGDSFEKYIVKMFDQNYFKIKEWRSDKYINGIYAESNKYPDLEIEYSMNSSKFLFAIECKFRSTLNTDETFYLEERKIFEYRKFERDKKIPVYLVIGIGGFPNRPNSLFLIPLNQIWDSNIPKNILNKYGRDVEDDFYFNDRTKTLK